MNICNENKINTKKKKNKSTMHIFLNLKINLQKIIFTNSKMCFLIVMSCVKLLNFSDSVDC